MKKFVVAFAAVVSAAGATISLVMEAEASKCFTAQ
jgi:hypothetical protein